MGGYPDGATASRDPHGKEAVHAAYPILPRTPTRVSPGLHQPHLPHLHHPGQGLVFLLATSLRHRINSGPCRPPTGHHCRYHRFFRQAAWSLDGLWYVLACLLLHLFAPTGLIEVVVDDTPPRRECRRRSAADGRHERRAAGESGPIKVEFAGRRVGTPPSAPFVVAEVIRPNKFGHYERPSATGGAQDLRFWYGEVHERRVLESPARVCECPGSASGLLRASRQFSLKSNFCAASLPSGSRTNLPRHSGHRSKRKWCRRRSSSGASPRLSSMP